MPLDRQESTCHSVARLVSDAASRTGRMLPSIRHRDWVTVMFGRRSWYDPKCRFEWERRRVRQAAIGGFAGPVVPAGEPTFFLPGTN